MNNKSEKINFTDLIEKLKSADDVDCTDFPVIGESPWGEKNWPTGVWSWDENQQLVLIGTCGDDAEVISYSKAREIFE